jgi:serine phosphatase RsbU (regulator of sigma subunit)
VLRDTFSGYINTTMSVLQIEKSGRATVFNCGGPGFAICNKGVVSKVSPRGSLVGMQQCAEVGVESFSMTTGSFAVGYTDGVVEGARATKRLFDVIATYASSDPRGLISKMLDLRQQESVTDDRTIVIASKK